jgi:hypothetical protein
VAPRNQAPPLEEPIDPSFAPTVGFRRASGDPIADRSHYADPVVPAYRSAVDTATPSIARGAIRQATSVEESAGFGVKSLEACKIFQSSAARATSTLIGDDLVAVIPIAYL